MMRINGQFAAGAAADNKLPIGSVTVRTRHGRRGEQRAWVKVAEPNVWRLRAQVVWETQNGPIPFGAVVHHRDENTLNDDAANLELLSKAKHLATHRPEFADRAVAGLVRARRERRWSTKSATKRTGRPVSWTAADLAAALDACRAGETAYAVAKRTGISRTTLCRALRST